MRILTVNAGSSSIKFAIVEADGGARVKEGTAAWAPAEAHAAEEAHRALAAFASGLTPAETPDAIAHRIVHGGERFRAPVVVDAEVRERLGMLVSLAPLHIPQSLALIDAARRLFPALPQVAVFDTAFHATLPARAARYALPERLCTELGIRRFGFHGLSHAHVADATAALLGRPAAQLKIVSCHLGNGASVTAIEHGVSTETSMGMTPLEGLVMGTRAGDLDPGAILALLRSGRHSIRELEILLNNGAGLEGMTGTTEMQQIEARAADGDEPCRLALAVYGHRVRKYIGAYAATMGGVDVIAFTGGIGEHSAAMRSRCTQRLAFLGAFLDEDLNRRASPKHGAGVDVSDATSNVRILVIAADEERVMAREAKVATATSPRRGSRTVPVAISARHAHLTAATLAQLFGPGFELHVREPLAQPGQFAAEETVTLVGPRGRLEHVRLIGPPRAKDQVELSRSDEFVLGIDAPVRDSGDLGGTPGILVEGPAGRAALLTGVICARRHLHLHVADATTFGLRDGDLVAVRLGPPGEEVVFRSVRCRVSESFTTQLHLDFDEANAARVGSGDRAELLGDVGLTRMDGTLQFLGAAGTVTGSRYFVAAAGQRLLVDCGLFQGYKQLRLRNRARFPVPPSSLDAVLLTHAHVDHSGYLPRLVADGFSGPIFCTEATFELCKLLLPDSGRLQEEEAAYAARKHYSRHAEPLPLYTEKDALQSLQRFRVVDFRRPLTLAPSAAASWLPAGHLLGAAQIRLDVEGRRVHFSGDLGRADDELTRAPEPFAGADVLVMESTYGNRLHPVVDIGQQLSEIVRRVAKRGGVLIVPAFAVGRVQGLMLQLARLRRRGEIPAIPMFLNSPMAVAATDLYHRFQSEHRASHEDLQGMFELATPVHTVEESKALNERKGPMIIISASGMLTGGRVLHHVAAFGQDPRNAILVTGFQAGGTRGAALLAGQRRLRMFGHDVEIGAEVLEIQGLSGHADANGLLAWASGTPAPREVYVTHGEPDAADALRARLKRELSWPALVPEQLQEVPL